MATPTIDAMILGALHEHPMSAYEMNKMMDQRGVRGWSFSRICKWTFGVL